MSTHRDDKADEPGALNFLKHASEFSAPKPICFVPLLY